MIFWGTNLNHDLRQRYRGDVLSLDGAAFELNPNRGLVDDFRFGDQHDYGLQPSRAQGV